MRDGVYLYGDVYRPLGDDPTPTLIFFGPFGKTFLSSVLFTIQFFF